MLNNALAGRNRSASDVSRCRLSSVKLRNHKVGYFDPLLWAVRMMIFVKTFCICGKHSVVLCLRNGKYGRVSSLIQLSTLNKPTGIGLPWPTAEIDRSTKRPSPVDNRIINTFTRNSISFPHGRSTAAHKSNQLCNVISPMNNIGYVCAMNTSKDCRLRDCTRYFIRSSVVILLVDALYIHVLPMDKCEIIVKP